MHTYKFEKKTFNRYPLVRIIKAPKEPKSRSNLKDVKDVDTKRRW